MKWRLFVTVALTLLSLGGMTAALITLQGSREAVVFTASTLYGDPAWADGLTVECRANYLNRADWTSALHFHDRNFDSTTRYQYWQNHWKAEWLDMRNLGRPSMSVQWDLGIPDAYKTAGTGIYRAYQELLSELAPGERGEKTIRAADYYAFYPLLISLNFPDQSMWSLGESRIYEENSRDIPSQYKYQPPERFRAVWKRFDSFFQIPVLESQYMTIGVQKKTDGSMGMTSMLTGYRDGPGDDYELESRSAFDGNAWYFAFRSAKSKNGVPMDFSRVNGGFGVYRLPYVPGDGTTRWDDVDEDGLSTVYSLDPETEVLFLGTAADNKRLLLGTKEGEQYYLSVIRIMGMELLQKLEIGTGQEDYGFIHVYQRDNYLVCDFLDRLAVLEEQEGGTYVVTLRTTRTVESMLNEGNQEGTSRHWDTLRASEYDASSFLDWDGTRLAVAWNPRVALPEDGPFPGALGRWSRCGFRLAVFAEDTLQYFGNYASSLDGTIRASIPGYPVNGNFCKPPRQPLTVRWTGERT